MAAIHSIAEKNNSTVIDRSVAVPNSTTRERSERAVNEFGQTQIKGGTTLNDGFFQSIINGYANLVNTPLALTLVIVGVVGLLLEAVGNENGPLERLWAACNNKAASSNGLIKGLAMFLASIAKFLIPYKFLLFASLMFWGPYAAKPSRNNLWISSVSTVLIALFDFPAVELIVIGQLYLCYTQVRNPKYRVVIFLVTVICFFIGSEMLKELHTGGPPANKLYSGGGSVTNEEVKKNDAQKEPTPEVILLEKQKPLTEALKSGPTATGPATEPSATRNVRRARPEFKVTTEQPSVPGAFE